MYSKRMHSIHCMRSVGNLWQNTTLNNKREYRTCVFFSRLFCISLIRHRFSNRFRIKEINGPRDSFASALVFRGKLETD